MADNAEDPIVPDDPPAEPSVIPGSAGDGALAFIPPNAGSSRDEMRSLSPESRQRKIDEDEKTKEVNRILDEAEEEVRHAEGDDRQPESLRRAGLGTC